MELVFEFSPKEDNHMLSLNRNRFIFSFLFIGVLLPAAWADQVWLKNGDRVTGGIIKKDGKNLTIKTDQFGVVVIPWDQVDSITAEKPLHLVLNDGRTLEGTLKTADGKIEVTTPQTRVSVTSRGNCHYAQ